MILEHIRNTAGACMHKRSCISVLLRNVRKSTRCKKQCVLELYD